jgi:hypothetical protein
LDDTIIHAKKINSRKEITYKVVAYKCSICFKYHVGRNGNVVTKRERIKWNKDIKNES